MCYFISCSARSKCELRPSEPSYSLLPRVDIHVLKMFIFLVTFALRANARARAHRDIDAEKYVC